MRAARRLLLNSAAPAARLPCSLARPLSPHLPPAKPALLQGGKGRGAERGCLVSSFSLPPPPPSADASGAPAAAPLHSRLAPGEGGWRCGVSQRAGAGRIAPEPEPEPRPCARRRRRQPGSRGSAVSPAPPAPPPPQTCRRRGGGVPGDAGAAEPAAWLPRGRLEFSLGCRHRPHLENCRASSQQGRERASNRDARTLTCGHFASKQTPGRWVGGGRRTGWGRRGWGGSVNLPQATKRRPDGNVAELTLELAAVTGDAGQGSGAGVPGQGGRVGTRAFAASPTGGEGPRAGRAQRAQVGGDWGPAGGKTLHMLGAGSLTWMALEEAQGAGPAHCPSDLLGGGLVLLFCQGGKLSQSG